MNTQGKATEAEVHHLLRITGRSFYPYQCVLILDALMFHSVLYEEDILKLTCMHKKAFRSFCTKLLEDRLIVSHVQKEETTGMQAQYRWMNRTYYYIHHIEAIDAIKWKVHCLVKRVKDEIGQLNNPQGYVCPTCHAKYSLIDVPSLISEDKLRFECSVCGDTLVEDDSGLEAAKGQERLERLMAELEPIIESLKKIDGMKIEDNNFETSLVKAIPPASSSLATYTVSSKASRKKKEEQSNEAKRAQATVHVSITADDEEIRQERQQREERNEKLRQNALPSWHRESAVGQGSLGVLNEETSGSSPAAANVEGLARTNVTISGGDSAASPAVAASAPLSRDGIPSSVELSAAGSSAGATNTEIKQEQPPSGLSEESTAEEMDALSAYYAQLRQRQAEEDNEDDDDDDDDDDEDEHMDDDDDEDEDDEDEFEAFEEAEKEAEQAEQAGQAAAPTSSSTEATPATEAKPTAAKEASAEISDDDDDDDADDDIDEAIFEEMANEE